MNGADGISDIKGKAARVAVSEWNRGDASDIDGQNREVEMGGSTLVNAGYERVSMRLVEPVLVTMFESEIPILLVTRSLLLEILLSHHVQRRGRGQLCVA